MNDKNILNTELDPEVIKVRDKIISKIGDKSLDEVNSVIKKLLNEQMDEITRLGALAARVKIIRSKIENLYESKVGKKKENIKVQKEEKSEPLPEKSNDEKWVRVKMIETGEVNGKQIDKGVILDVKEGDSTKLVEAKKAEIVEENIDGAAPIKKDEDKNKQDSIKSAEKDDKSIKESKQEEPEKKAEPVQSDEKDKKAETVESKQKEEKSEDTKADEVKDDKTEIKVESDKNDTKAETEKADESENKEVKEDSDVKDEKKSDEIPTDESKEVEDKKITDSGSEQPEKNLTQEKSEENEKKPEEGNEKKDLLELHKEKVGEGEK